MKTLAELINAVESLGLESPTIAEVALADWQLFEELRCSPHRFDLLRHLGLPRPPQKFAFVAYLTIEQIVEVCRRQGISKMSELKKKCGWNLWNYLKRKKLIKIFNKMMGNRNNGRIMQATSAEEVCQQIRLGTLKRDSVCQSGIRNLKPEWAEAINEALKEARGPLRSHKKVKDGFWSKMPLEEMERLVREVRVQDPNIVCEGDAIRKGHGALVRAASRRGMSHLFGFEKWGGTARSNSPLYTSFTAVFAALQLNPDNKSISIQHFLRRRCTRYPKKLVLEAMRSIARNSPMDRGSKWLVIPMPFYLWLFAEIGIALNDPVAFEAAYPNMAKMLKARQRGRVWAELFPSPPPGSGKW